MTRPEAEDCRPYSAELSRLAAGTSGDATGPSAGDLEPEVLLNSIRSLGDIQTEASRLQREAVVAARQAKVSWARIGAVLGISRQAAHQRFMVNEGLPGAEDRIVGHVTRADEVEALRAAGLQGWWPVESRHGEHVVRHSGTSWEVQRVSAVSIGKLPSEAEGWTVATTRFPDCFYIREQSTGT